MSTPIYRKNVKAKLVEGLLAAGFTYASETSFRKVTPSFVTYTVTLSNTYYTVRTREMNLKEGWTEIRQPYTSQTIKNLLHPYW